MGKELTIHAALNSYLKGYGRHFLTDVEKVPELSVELDGPFIEARVSAPDGRRKVRRRASAYLTLAGEIWGSSRGPKERERLPVLIPALTSRPLGGANGWDIFHGFETDEDVIGGLRDIALLVNDQEPTEATLILRRIYEVDDDWSEYPEPLPRGLPENLRKAVKARAEIIEPLLKKSSYTPGGVAKAVARGASSEDPKERLATAVALSQAASFLSTNNHLSFMKIVEPAVMALVSEGDGASYEIALGLAQHLGAKLLLRGAYPEAKRMLELIVPRQVGLAESLRSRWECRLYLDDPDAEEDWSAAARLDNPATWSHLGHCMFWSGDVVDRRSVALSRVAAGLVARATGGDPCRDRRVTAKSKPSEEERTRLLGRAMRLADAALEDTKPRADEDIAKARKEPVTERGFQADAYAARGKVREALGELEGALEDFEKARKIRVAGGLSWQADHFGKEIRRIKELLFCDDSSVGATPPTFELKWLLAKERSSEEREAAIDFWGSQPWRVFPKTPLEALGQPYAHVLLKPVIAGSEYIWKVAEKDKINLGDRLEFADRARDINDTWADLTGAWKLESALENAPYIAFGLEIDHHGLAKTTKKKRLSFLRWVQSLTVGSKLTEDDVLTGVEGQPWARLRALFESNVDHMDTLRDLFDGLRETGMGNEDLCSLLRAYEVLLSKDWTKFGTPKKEWLAYGKALTRLDAKSVAPVLVEWTLRYRKNPGPWSRRFPAKLLWPLYYVWDSSTVSFLLAVRRGEHDHGARLSKAQRKSRTECLEWFAEKVGPL